MNFISEKAVWELYGEVVRIKRYVLELEDKVIRLLGKKEKRTDKEEESI